MSDVIDPARLERIERAIAVLAADRLQKTPLCHCGASAVYYDPQTIGHRDLCEEHGEPSPHKPTVERVDANIVRALTSFLAGYEPPKSG